MTERARFRPGFRLRVLGFFALLLGAALAGGLLLQRAFLLRDLDREVDAALQQERSELARLASGNDPATGAPFGTDVAALFDTFLQRNIPEEGEIYVAFVDGSPYRTTPGPIRLDRIPALVDRWGDATTGERGTIPTEVGPVEFLAVPLQNQGRTLGVFVIANAVQGERDEIAAAIRVEAVVSAAVLLLATVVAWFVAGRLLRPVHELIRTADTITETDLTRRIPVHGHDEISRLARTFNAMLDRLETAFTTQRSFIDDAGHELRTPITIIRGHLELMGDDPVDRADTMVVVTEELDRMARMVDDLLLLAKAEQPDFVRPEPVELADLTLELLTKARSLGDRVWRLDGSADGVFPADPQRITQAVLNLARNAVEHTRPGDEIALGSGWSAGEVRIWVRDTGPGIEQADQARIFERFARGRAGRRSDGAGLGLAIVQSIATAHGGRVTLDSAPGHGATFTVVLPAPGPHPPIEPTETDDESPEVTSWHAS
jgi:signal transduction histidine kinase